MTKLAAEICIHSSRSNRTLSFSEFDGWKFCVVLSGDLQVRTVVYGYAPHAVDLGCWFAQLGRHTSPWPGRLLWESLEGEFKLSASCTALGGVQFVVELTDGAGTREERFVRAGIESELAQLATIASEAARFFTSKQPGD